MVFLCTQIRSPEEAECLTSRRHGTQERKSLVAATVRPHVVSYRKEQLNDFLTSCGASPVRTVDMGLPMATERTKRRNIEEACQVVVTVLQTLSPSYPGELWQDIKDSDNMCETLKVTNNFKQNKIELKEGDMKYLSALSETYNNVTSGNVKRQILSILADITTLEEIRKFIPGLTKYMFCQTRKHILVCGRGVPILVRLI